MAKHRIGRFQFGVLDLLILTTVVAVVAVLARPARYETRKAAPWIIGCWSAGPGLMIGLFPDGYYAYYAQPPSLSTPAVEVEGVGWRLDRCNVAQDAFVLTCGDKKFFVRSEWGSGMMELLSESGAVESQLQLLARLEGPMSRGAPHGTWRGTLQALQIISLSLEYRNGELRDAHTDRVRQFALINKVRKARGLPALTERDFPDESPPDEKAP